MTVITHCNASVTHTRLYQIAAMPCLLLGGAHVRNWVEALVDVEHVLRSGVQLLLAMSFRKDAPAQEQRTETSDVMFLLKKGWLPILFVT